MAPLAQAPDQMSPALAALPPAQALEIMLNSRAMALPDGADPTFTLDGPDQIWYLIVAITSIAIPGIFLMVRIYTKLSVVRRFELADYFIFLAFPLLIVEVALGYQMIRWGSGVHQWQITFRQLFSQLYWTNAAEVVYSPMSFLVKMAILLQYIRLFAPSRQLNRTMWYGSWAMIAALFVFYTVFMFWTMFYCYPRRMIWDKFTPGGHCHDHSPIVIAQGIFNMISDIIILLLPTRSLWQLNVPLARKLVITGLFCTGLLAFGASVGRIIYTLKIAPVYNMADVSHNGLFIGLWTEAEVALGFIVACSLSLPKLFQAKRNKLGRAFSTLTSPFSTMRSTVRSKARPSPQNSLNSSKSKASTTDTLRSSDRIEMIEKNPVVYAEPEEMVMPPERKRTVESRLYAIPSEYGSSTYTHSLASESRSSSPETIAPLNFNKHTHQIHQPQQTAFEHELSLNTAGATAHRRGSRIIGLDSPVLNGHVSGHQRRLTQEEIQMFQQYQFIPHQNRGGTVRGADKVLSPRI